MEEAVPVHVRQTKHSLEHDAFDLLLRELLCSIFHQLVDVLLHVLKDEIQVVIHTNHFFELDDLWMVQFSKRLDLSKGHALLPRVELLLHLFDSYLFSALSVHGLNN